MKHLQTLFFGFIVAFLPNVAQAVVPDDGEIKFQILRNGDPFGMHILAFQENADGTLSINIDINMKFSLGPIALFRYEHENEEIWRGEKILSVNSTTNDDGDDYLVDAVWQGDVVTVQNQDESYEGSGAMFSTSYWNMKTLKADQLLNTQKGIIENITVTDVAPQEIDVAGSPRMAIGYDIDASVPIRVWYDQQTEQWIGLEFEVRGSKLEYRRLNPIDTQVAQGDGS